MFVICTVIKIYLLNPFEDIAVCPIMCYPGWQDLLLGYISGIIYKFPLLSPLKISCILIVYFIYNRSLNLEVKMAGGMTYIITYFVRNLMLNRYTFYAKTYLIRILI